jgi:hypothetical protein
MIDSSLVLCLSVLVSFSRSGKQHDKKDIVLFSSYEIRSDWEHVGYRKSEDQSERIHIRTVRAFPLFQGTSTISFAFLFHLGISSSQPMPGNQDGKFFNMENMFCER